MKRKKFLNLLSLSGISFMLPMKYALGWNALSRHELLAIPFTTQVRHGLLTPPGGTGQLPNWIEVFQKDVFCQNGTDRSSGDLISIHLGINGNSASFQLINNQLWWKVDEKEMKFSNLQTQNQICLEENNDWSACVYKPGEVGREVVNQGKEMLILPVNGPCAINHMSIAESKAYLLKERGKATIETLNNNWILTLNKH